MSNRVPSDDWKDLDDETRHGFWYAGKWIVAAIVFIVVVSAALWAFGVFSSDIKGRGDAERTKNSAGNRIAAQEGFHVLLAQVTTSDQRLDGLRDAHEADPTDVIAKTNYTGAVAFCIQARNDYNAETQKFTREAFRDANLPELLDPADPKYDCKPTPKETPK